MDVRDDVKVPLISIVVMHVMALNYSVPYVENFESGMTVNYGMSATTSIIKSQPYWPIVRKDVVIN